MYKEIKSEVIDRYVDVKTTLKNPSVKFTLNHCCFIWLDEQDNLDNLLGKFLSIYNQVHLSKLQGIIKKSENHYVYKFIPNYLIRIYLDVQQVKDNKYLCNIKIKYSGNYLEYKQSLQAMHGFQVGIATNFQKYSSQYYEFSIDNQNTRNLYLNTKLINGVYFSRIALSKMHESNQFEISFKSLNEAKKDDTYRFTPSKITIKVFNPNDFRYYLIKYLKYTSFSKE